jgi:hypothetical protein
MKSLFLGIVLILTATQTTLAAKSVKVDSAKIKHCFILGYCDVQVMNPSELPRGWRESQLSQPILRIRILDINEADQFDCRAVSRHSKWEFAKTQLQGATSLHLEINGKFKGNHATRVFVDGKSLTDLIIQFRC